jgi:hypothetical protein
MAFWHGSVNEAGGLLIGMQVEQIAQYVYNDKPAFELDQRSTEKKTTTLNPNTADELAFSSGFVQTSLATMAHPHVLGSLPKVTETVAVEVVWEE